MGTKFGLILDTTEYYHQLLGAVIIHPDLLASGHHYRVGAVKPEPHRDGHTPTHQHQKYHFQISMG